MNYGKVYETSVNMTTIRNQIGADSVFRIPGYYLGEIITTTKADGTDLSLTSPNLISMLNILMVDMHGNNTFQFLMLYCQVEK